MNKFLSKWLRRNLVQILAWSLFITYETVVAGFAFGLWANPLTYVFHYTINIAFFYLYGLWLFPWSLSNKKYAFYRFPFAILLGTTLFILLNYCCDFGLIRLGIIANEATLSLEKHYVIRVLYRGIYFLVYSLGYYLLISYLDTRKAAEILETERLNAIIADEKMKRELARAQNAFLKAQINPHFLFNTLDYIYHNVSGLSKEAGDAIVSLSQMMRYAIDSDNEEESIILGKEIEQVEKLLGLYQLRQNMGLNIEVYFGEETFNLHFIPLVLMTMVENMIKHGNLLSTDHEALVAVYIVKESLFIKTRNVINYNTEHLLSNKGLKNIAERLNYSYGNDASFFYGRVGESEFEAIVTVSLSAIKFQAPKSG